MPTCAAISPTVESINPNEDIIVDGTLCPTVDYQDHLKNYSGKHHQAGMNIQVACNLYHEPVFISDPLPGSTHDAAALQATGLLEYFANSQARIIGDSRLHRLR